MCGIVGLLQGRRRVVIDRECVSEYKDGRLLRQYPLREITSLRLEFNAMRLVFADRGAITIPNIWPGAGELRHHLQSVIDLRAGGAPPVDDWLALNYLTFPSRCVSCGSSEVVEHTIFAGTLIHMPNVNLVRGFDIAVPACRRCSRRRKAVGFSATLALIVGTIGLFVAAIASERFEGMPFSVFLIAFMMIFVIVHVATSQARQWLDRRLLGVAALRLGKDKTTVQLWFRDRQLEIEVRALTAESRTLVMSSTAGILRGLNL